MVHVFSDKHPSGEQLGMLSGVAAILRFPLPLDDMLEAAAQGDGADGDDDDSNSSTSDDDSEDGSDDDGKAEGGGGGLGLEQDVQAVRLE